MALLLKSQSNVAYHYYPSLQELVDSLKNSEYSEADKVYFDLYQEFDYQGDTDDEMVIRVCEDFIAAYYNSTAELWVIYGESGYRESTSREQKSLMDALKSDEIIPTIENIEIVFTAEISETVETGLTVDQSAYYKNWYSWN